MYNNFDLYNISIRIGVNPERKIIGTNVNGLKNA